MNLSGRNVLVTGADGFIGSHVVEHLVQEGANVTALSYYNAFGSAGWLDRLAGSKLVRGVNIISGDIRDPFFISRQCKESEIILHLAALIAIPFSYIAPQSYIETNITGTLNILEAARRYGAERIVHTSTSEVYGTAKFTPITENHPLQGQSPYSASKIGADHMVEAYAKSYDLPVVILRPFNTYGPRQSERAVIPSVIRQVLDPDCQELRIGLLNPIRDFNYVDDIAAAFLTAATCPNLEFGSAYNAGSGEGLTIANIIDIIQKLAGTEKSLRVENKRLRPEKSEVLALIAGAEKFKSVSDWRSKIDFTEGVTRTINWWRDELKNERQRSLDDFQL